MEQSVIVGYKRSPFTPANKGKLIQTRPDDLVAHVIKELVKDTNIKVEDIEDIQMGCAFPEGEQGLNVARLASFIAELPHSIAATTINRFCGSSMQAIHNAAGAIAAGAGDLFIAAGVESMTRIPMGGFNPMPHPELYENLPGAYMSMGETAENLAKKYNISRQEQDTFALNSQQKAAQAREKNAFTEEIVPIHSNGDTILHDGCIRPDTSLEGLAGLDPAFDTDGTVTAGSSSPLTDGASAVLVCSESYAKAHNLPILARIIAFAVAGCDPEIMGIGPVHATNKALKRASLSLNDIDIIELNEAFAAQSLACIKELELDESRINLDGGAIALGHPLGATGARIVGKAASLLKREGKKYALATQCIGGGQGIATILESS